VNDAELGAEMPVYFLDADGAIKGHDDPALGQPQEIVFPVIVRDEAVSTVTLDRKEAGPWEVATLGRAPLARSLNQPRRGLAQRGVTSPLAMISVRELGVRFLVRHEQNGLVFTPFMDSAAAGLPVGQDVPWTAVAAALSGIAAHHVAPAK
jgi:hypothetical protein